MGVFNYLGKFMDRLDKYWLEVPRNIRKVWGCLGKLLCTEGMEPFVSANFYWGVVQVVLLFGEDTWQLLVEINKV